MIKKTNNKKNILVVDDDRMVRKLLSDALSLHRFSVYAVEGGKSALDLLKKMDFDIVITDYSMPDIDGIELAKTIRSQYPRSLIIGISADCDERDFMDAGADAFLHKPFYLHDLLSMIQEKI
ncbi:MAG: response regulator [Nitrospirae bacterium]|jgi:CheY-like chemotaxis protein|nr:response regulator [Nitrospirota bacterium]MCL5063142.1 response regulator [Nitrospirota bacterium]MDA8215404.1 response regulator [Nitrospiraceae bacterium]MDA8338838.1 response regulator [Nitrospiraceae bacterium]